MHYSFNLKVAPRQESRRVDYRPEQASPAESEVATVVRFRAGLVLNISRMGPGLPNRASFAVELPPVQFGFIHSGANHCTYTEGHFCRQTHHLAAGSNGIYYLPGSRGVIQSDPARGSCVVSLLVTPELLGQYLEREQDETPQPLRGVVEGRLERSLAWFAPPRPYKAGILDQILSCPVKGAGRRLFLESRVLELLACQVEEMLAAQGRGAPSHPRLKDEDLDRVRLARDILVKDLGNPPSLVQLARLCGLNQKKLKLGFRQVYGGPVYEYFREYRLERARGLLAGGQWKVGEVAFQVGYWSLGHFSQAFRRRFGQNPRDFLPSRRTISLPGQAVEARPQTYPAVSRTKEGERASGKPGTGGEGPPAGAPCR